MAKKGSFFIKNRKTSHLGGVLLFIGAFVFLYALFFPLYRLLDYIICFTITLLAGGVFYLFISGAFAKNNNAPPPQWSVSSGDEALDRFMEDGQVLLTELSLEKERIGDILINEKVDELVVICKHMFSAVQEKPEKLPQIRRFMNYYLPTTAQLLKKYRLLLGQQKDTALLFNTREQVLQALALIIPASEKQLKALYQNEVLDIKTDVEVLEKMLEKDGFIPSSLHNSSINNEKRGSHHG